MRALSVPGRVADLVLVPARALGLVLVLVQDLDPATDQDLERGLDFEANPDPVLNRNLESGSGPNLATVWDQQGKPGPELDLGLGLRLDLRLDLGLDPGLVLALDPGLDSALDRGPVNRSTAPLPHNLNRTSAKLVSMLQATSVRCRAPAPADVLGPAVPRWRQAARSPRHPRLSPSLAAGRAREVPVVAVDLAIPAKTRFCEFWAHSLALDRWAQVKAARRLRWPFSSRCRSYPAGRRIR